MCIRSALFSSDERLFHLSGYVSSQEYSFMDMRKLRTGSTGLWLLPRCPGGVLSRLTLFARCPTSGLFTRSGQQMITLTVHISPLILTCKWWNYKHANSIPAPPNQSPLGGIADLENHPNHGCIASDSPLSLSTAPMRTVHLLHSWL